MNNKPPPPPLYLINRPAPSVLHPLGYRVCIHCHRRKRFPDTLCDCPESAEWRQMVLKERERRRSRMRFRHHRRALKPALLVHALIIPVVLLLVWWRQPQAYALPATVVLGHAVVSAGVGAVLALIANLLKKLGKQSRRHLRLRILAETILVWPLLAVMGLLVHAMLTS